jgi:formylglycine-generating enzyme required for sulfatase activity
MKMIYVEGGTFQMGATSEQLDDAYSDEKPVHTVTLSSYYIAECEVTRAQWRAVMGYDPSSYYGYENHPVVSINRNQAQAFCEKLSELTGKRYALPTEAQWEFAARGGNKSEGYKYSGSNTLGDVAWYDNNSGGHVHEVKQKQPNELGIYDMSGNVWEWCSDWFGDYSSWTQTDPTGPSTGSNTVFRGGGKGAGWSSCRVSYRDGNDSPTDSYSDSGFRVVCLP